MEKQGGNSEILGQKNNFKIHSQTYQTFPLSIYASLQQTNKRILQYLRFGHKIKKSGFLILKAIHTKLQSKHLLISTHRAKPSAREEQRLSNSWSALSHQRIWNSAHDLKQWLAPQTRPCRCAKCQVRAVAFIILSRERIYSGRGYTYIAGHWKMRQLSWKNPWAKHSPWCGIREQSQCLTTRRVCVWTSCAEAVPESPSQCAQAKQEPQRWVIFLFWLNN